MQQPAFIIASVFVTPPSNGEHPIATLNKFLQAVPHLIPNDNPSLHTPTIRHPDLNPNNIFISPSPEITSLIDWQHTCILPLFLQCGIPDSLQNYGDAISDTLQVPSFPDNFSNLDETAQSHKEDLFGRRQIHYQYFAKTAALNKPHFDALSYRLSIPRRRLFRHASEP
ncbi:hypothetical protein BJX64DRAFT_294140 [Aspergillus heterothallicus]